MLHGRILRSTQPHARIVKIDTSAALAVPGVVAIVAGSDVPRDESGPRRFGTATRDTPVLATDRVRYVGEPIAVVAATDLDAAAEAIARMEAEFEPLTPMLTIHDALDWKALAIHADGNVVGTREERMGDVDAALGIADAVVTESFDVPAVQGVPLETHTVIAEWDSDGLTVRTATQTPYHVRRELAHVFDLPAERVRVIAGTLGGGFGAKAYTRIEPLAALVAQRAGRPVKFVLSRSEEFVTVQRQAARVTFTTGVSRDGRLVALRAHCDFASGAYTDNTPRVLRHGLYSLVGPYRIGTVEISTRGLFTNTPPCGPLRAPGTAQVQWAREAHLDAVAMAVGVSPIELRRRNLLAASDRFILGGPMGPVHLPELLDAVVPAEPGAPTNPRRRRGSGVALAMKTTATPTTAEASVTIDRRGRIGLLISTVDMGQGARMALAQIAASAMNVPVAQVDVTLPDTRSTPPDDGTVSSHSTFSMGTAIQRASEKLRERLLAIGQQQLEIARTDLVVEDGRLVPVDGSSAGLSFGDLVGRSGEEVLAAKGAFTNEPMSDPLTGEAGVSTHHHQAAASALVEVDLDTGAVEVLQVRVATHAGVVVNPVLSELQSEGNVAFGVGQALMEELIMDGGQVQNASLADYVTPSFLDMPPRIDVVLTEDDLHEIHGIGETALPAVVPAVTNAVADAAGSRIHAIPATPERVLRAISPEVLRSRPGTLISAGVGLMIAFIGLNPVTGTPRFTFEQLYLWDGIGIVPILIGLFAGSEVLSLFGKRHSVMEIRLEDEDGRESRFRDGIVSTLRAWKTVVISSVLGFAVGLVPGVGGTVASFIAYGQAARMSGRPEEFGTGRVEGVIAAETANDADKSGSLLPTIAFGIPGGVAMAVLLGALILHGVPAGPNLLRNHIDVVYVLIIASIIPRLMAAGVVSIIGARAVWFTRIRGEILAPLITTMALVGVFSLRSQMLDVLTLLVFGYVGYAMERHGFSRVSLVIAVILGGIMESALHQTLATFGPSGFFTRPISLVLFGVALASLLIPIARRVASGRRSARAA